MARGIDPQFSRLYQIDPSAYEGPSTWEGLADLVSAINQSTAQQEEKKRYADEITYRDERDAVADKNTQDEKDWQQKVFDEEQSRYTTEQKQLIKSKEDASRNAFYERAVKDYGGNPLELSLYLESSGRFDGINSDTGTTYSDEFNLATLKKQGTAYNELKSHLDAMADPEQTTREEALDFLDTTDFSTAGVYGDELRQRAENMLTKRDAWFSQQLKNPFVEMEIKEIYNKHSVANTEDPASPRSLNTEGQTKLQAVYNKIRGTGAHETSYIGGLARGVQGPVQWGEPTRKGTYLYEGLQVSEISPSYPVDDKGELTEEASVVAKNINQAIHDGDSIAAVLDPSLNANQHVPDQEGLASIVEEYAPKGELKGLQKVAKEGTAALPVTKDLAKAVNAGISTLKESSQSLYQLSTPGTVASIPKDVFQEKYQGSSAEFKKTIKDMYNLYLRLDPSKGLKTTKIAGTGNQAMRTRIKRELQKLKKISEKGKWSPYKYDDEIAAILEDITFS